MSDQEFPGFADDEPAPPATTPAVPAKPATAPVKPSAARPAPASTKPAAPPSPPPALSGASGPVNFEFEESDQPAPKKRAYVPPPAEPAPPSAPSPRPSSGSGVRPTGAVDDGDVDPDIKPGSRKDLWTCPHCGTGNKPGRETCRSCGKTPDEPVIQPIYKKPIVILGIAGGAVLLLVLLFMMLGHADLTLKPPEVSSIDSKPRIGGSGTAHDLDGNAFTPSHRIAVCGRCIGASRIATIPTAWTVVLLLGKAGADADAAASADVKFNGDRTEIGEVGGKTTILRLLLPNAQTVLSKGTILSLTGDLGELSGLQVEYGDLTVWVDQLQQAP